MLGKQWRLGDSNVINGSIAIWSRTSYTMPWRIYGYAKSYEAGRLMIYRMALVNSKLRRTYA